MTDEEKKAFERLEEQIKGFRKELTDSKDQETITALQKDIDDLKDNIEEMKEAEVDEKILSVNKEVLKLREMIIAVREEQIKDRDNSGGKPKHVGVSKKEVENFIASTFKDGKKTSEQYSIALKDAEVFGIPTVYTGIADSDSSAFTGRYVDPTLYQRKRKKNLILDHFQIMSIDVPELLYLEKVEIGTGVAPDNDPGGAEWIASGAEKPMRSFRVGTGKVEAKKLAVFGTIEDKLLKDVPSFVNWINDDFSQEMRERYNDGLLNNNPAIDAEAPLGVKTNAITFSVTPAFDSVVVNPTVIDNIVAAVSAMSDLKEDPEKIFVSTDIFYSIHILKDANERYQNNGLVYVNSVGQIFIAGVEVVPADRDDIPSTHFLLIGAEVGFKIHNYGAPVLERGLNADDFRRDRTSFRGYQEVLSYVPSHRENSVMYDTFANVNAAIATI